MIGARQDVGSVQVWIATGPVDMQKSFDSLAERRAFVSRARSAEWTAQQIIEAFPFATASRFPMRERDVVYGEYIKRRVESLGTVLLL